MPRPTVWLAFGRRWALLFGGLFAALAPFDYVVLPAWGPAVLGWLPPALLGAAASPETVFVSDSAAQWHLAAGLLALTAVLALAWAALARHRPASEARLWYVLHTGAAWFLALHLLKYGFDKVFKMQFYLPEPNTLYTPLGELPPDLAYWSVTGASRGYTVFAGVAEVVPALLLLWGRTRWLGAVLALGVLAHVLALNLGFDISVKLWSGFLLGLAALVAWPALRLGGQLLAGRAMPVLGGPRPPVAWHGRGIGALRGLGLGLLLAEALAPAVGSGNFNDDAAPRPPLHGAYALRPDGPGPPPPLRLFVHRRGYLVTQTAAGEMRDYPLRYAPGRLLLRGPGGHANTLHYRTDSAGLHLRGTFGPDSVRWLARPLPWRQLPLLRGGHGAAAAAE